jgi:AcrR family transcriptional regulator
MYRSPTQLRAKKTEDTFLSAFRQLLSDQGFAKTSIDEIALLSGQTRSAFLSRFGTKKAALFVLFDEYCAEVSELMTNISLQIQRFDDAEACVNRMSTSLEARLIKHFASNRAMHEIYLEDLQTDE